MCIGQFFSLVQFYFKVVNDENVILSHTQKHHQQPQSKRKISKNMSIFFYQTTSSTCPSIFLYTFNINGGNLCVCVCGGGGGGLVAGGNAEC
jgi:hypothetical protein